MLVPLSPTLSPRSAGGEREKSAVAVPRCARCGGAPKNTIAGNRSHAYLGIMKGQRFVYWQDGQFWLGYLEEFPDYLTQGESLDDLKEHLRDLYRDLTSGEIPAVRHVSELEVA